MPVRGPGAYAAEVFGTLCAAQGLALPKAEILAHPPADAIEVVVHQGEELSQVLRKMLRYTTNLKAEIVGLTASGAGTLEGSAAAMTDWARRRFGIAAVFGDHSGLGPKTRISAADLAQVGRARKPAISHLAPGGRRRLRVDPLHLEEPVAALVALDWLGRLDEEEERYVLLQDPEHLPLAPLAERLLLARQASTIATGLPRKDSTIVTSAPSNHHCVACTPLFPSPGGRKPAVKASTPTTRAIQVNTDSPRAIRPQGQPRADVVVFIKVLRRTGRRATARAG